MADKSTSRLRQHSSVIEEKPQADKLLGMQQPVTRRDFLNATLLASGSLLLNPLSPAELLAQNAPGEADDWTGYGGIGDYARSNGNTLGVVQAGHEIRDRAT